MKQQSTEGSGEIEGGGINQQSLFVYHVLTLHSHRIHCISLLYSWVLWETYNFHWKLRRRNVNVNICSKRCDYI